MFALLDIDNKTVISGFTPDVPFDKMIESANGRTLIKMTVENSPAGLNWTYVKGKFYPPKEITNA
jgi:hypothetical protein